MRTVNEPEPIGPTCQWCQRPMTPPLLSVRYHWACLREHNATLRAGAEVARINAREARARAAKVRDEMRETIDSL